MDTLPSIIDAYLKVYIRSDDYSATSWSLFLNPLSYEVWLALILVALVIAGVLTFVERFFDLGTKPPLGGRTEFHIQILD